MKDNKTEGYVIINTGHPRTGREFVDNQSFNMYKGKCIEIFIKDSGRDWRYWYRKYNFRCVKATSIITLER